MAPGAAQIVIPGPRRSDPVLDVDALFKHYEQWCLRVAMRVTKDHHHAQDAVQDAFLVYCRDWERFDAGRGNIGSWLAMLTHRRAVDLVRREASRPKPTPSPDTVTSHPGAALNPELQAAASIRSDQMFQLLRSLDPAKRQIIYMAYYLGYTQVQIAAATGLPLGTVKTRNRTALRELRSTLTAAA